MQPQTQPRAHSDRRAPNRKRRLALGLGVAAGLTASVVGVATARPAEPLRLSGPEVATDLRATLATEPEAAAILMLDAPAADDRAIARAQARALATLGADFVPSRQYAHVPAVAGRLHRANHGSTAAEG